MGSKEMEAVYFLRIGARKYADYCQKQVEGKGQE